MKDAKEIVDLVLNAHGRRNHWDLLNTVTIRVSIGGITWPRKGYPNSLDDIIFKANLHSPLDMWSPMFAPDQKAAYNGTDVSILKESGEIIEQLKSARDSFEGHELLTPWSKLQLVYLVGYATWNYMHTPFMFPKRGFHFLKMDPWEEGGETWRRLQVIFPESIPTHSTRQVFYFSEECLLKRGDYWPEVLGNHSAVHYYSDYNDFDGIKAPTTHRIYPLNDKDNSAIKDILLVSLDISSMLYE